MFENCVNLEKENNNYLKSLKILITLFVQNTFRPNTSVAAFKGKVVFCNINDHFCYVSFEKITTFLTIEVVVTKYRIKNNL